MSTELYTPQGCKPLSEITVRPQIRLGVQGEPKVGKTYNALTFPNPVVCNFDRGLGAHAGRADVIEVPFYDGAFCDKIIKRDGINAPPNKKDSFKKWITTEAMKLTSNQTLVIDGNTSLQAAYETQYNLNPPISSRTGKIDERAIWGDKITYFGEICDSIKALACDVIYIAHEIPDRNDKGELNGSVRPLMSGQFGDQLASHFTDWFRAHCITKPKDEMSANKLKTLLCCDDAHLKSLVAASKTDVMYLWQTMPDSMAKCASSTLRIDRPKFIVATYESMLKYAKTNFPTPVGNAVQS